MISSQTQCFTSGSNLVLDITDFLPCHLDRLRQCNHWCFVRESMCSCCNVALLLSYLCLSYHIIIIMCHSKTHEAKEKDLDFHGSWAVVANNSQHTLWKVKSSCVASWDWLCFDSLDLWSVLHSRLWRSTMPYTSPLSSTLLKVLSASESVICSRCFWETRRRIIPFWT